MEKSTLDSSDDEESHSVTRSALGDGAQRGGTTEASSAAETEPEAPVKK